MAKVRVGLKKSKEKPFDPTQTPAQIAESEGTLPLEEEIVQRMNISAEEIQKIRSYEEDQEKLLEEHQEV